MNLSRHKITEIFYLVDEFCIQFEASISANLIGNAPKREPLYMSVITGQVNRD